MKRPVLLTMAVLALVSSGTIGAAAQQPQQPPPPQVHGTVRGQVQPTAGTAVVRPSVVVPAPAPTGAVGTTPIRPAHPGGVGQVVAQPIPGQHVAIPGEVIVILGLETPGAIDPSIANEPALRQPAFQVFRTMRLLARPQLALLLGRPAVVQLPNGRRMQILVAERRADGRFQVRISINRPGLADYLPSLTVVLSPGAPIFQVGQAHAGGTLVIGVRVGLRPVDPMRGRLTPEVRGRVIIRKDA